MLKIKISRNSSYPLERQLPNREKVLGECVFYFTPHDSVEREYDFWFILDNLIEAETTICPPENIVYLTMEPLAFRKTKKDERAFLKQFSTVIDFQQRYAEIPSIESWLPLQWHIGWSHGGVQTGADFCRDYDFFKRRSIISKERKLSVVTSGPRHYKGHRDRYTFVMEYLKPHFGDRIEIFGRGIRDFRDKVEVIEPFKYHLALENGSEKNYFTEKLTDSFLGLAYPIYFGAPNIYDFFSPDMLTVIDINKPKEAIAIIEQILDQDFYEKRLPFLCAARDLVLDKYNLFSFIEKFCIDYLQRNPHFSASVPVTLHPKKQMQGWRRWMNTMMRGL